MSLRNNVLVKKIHGAYTTLLARYRLKKLSRCKPVQGRKIRVGFIVQMPEIWGEEKPVYDAMNQDERFETYLIVVPSYNFSLDRLKSYGAELSFFENEQHGDNLLKAIDENEDIIDLEKYQFDYVFLQRPYDHYLPKPLRSRELLRHAKTCYIPYGQSASPAFNEHNTSKAFFKNIYFSFSDSDTINEILLDQFSDTVRKGLQHFESLGFPPLEKYFNFPSAEENCEILWTPRWSTDPELGGSHFMEYREKFLALANECSDARFSFRPHPLMFENLLKEGLLSHEEITSYLHQLKQLHIRYSMGVSLIDDFSSAGILITDFSSIMIEYFLTGRPMIYCSSHFELNEEYSKMFPGIYVANNWEDLRTIVKRLRAGEDVLKDKRKKIIQEFYQVNSGATLRIVDRIASDAFQTDSDKTVQNI